MLRKMNFLVVRDWLNKRWWIFIIEYYLFIKKLRCRVIYLFGKYLLNVF